MKYIGIDIGGTKIEVALLEFSGENQKGDFRVGIGKEDLFGRILAGKRAPTQRHRGYEFALDTIETLVRDVCREQQAALNEIQGMGISMPGTVHPGTLQMLQGNTAIFVGQDLLADLGQRLKIDAPVACENDANCFAFAEAVCGAGVAYEEETGISVPDQVAVGLILGTGVGGGVVINGRMIRGRFGGAGEVGHIELFTSGHPCYCGKEGCVEQYLSGPALEAAFVNRIYSQVPKRPSAKEVFELAKRMDPMAIAVVKQYQRHLVKFLANLTSVFDPDYFVLGGGMSNPAAIYEGLEETLANRTFVPESAPRVYRHQLGDSAGVIGCVLPVLNREDPG